MVSAKLRAGTTTPPHEGEMSSPTRSRLHEQTSNNEQGYNRVYTCTKIRNVTQGIKPKSDTPAAQHDNRGRADLPQLVAIVCRGCRLQHFPRSGLESRAFRDTQHAVPKYASRLSNGALFFRIVLSKTPDVLLRASTGRVGGAGTG